MKKCVALLLCVMLLLCACGEENDLSDTPTTPDYPVETLTFNSLEEFLAAAENPGGNDPAELASLTEITVPAGIPEEYRLYKIKVNTSLISYYYLPEERLVDADTIELAEASHKHFCFWDTRWEQDFDRLLDEFGDDEPHVIDGEYYVNNYGGLGCWSFIWENGDNGMLMSAPVRMSFTDQEIAALCQTETISIDRVTDCPPAPVEYYSLEDFLAAVENPDDEAKSAELNTLTHITLPAGIPEGYGFYMIAAHAELISVYYFPVECLGNEDAIMEAKLAGRYYEFSEDRGSLDFESLVRQLGGSMDELVDGKYFLNGDGNKTVYWEQDGHVFWLNSPLDDLIWAEELPEICANETIELK